MATNNWTREQTIVALNLYCKIPFARVSSRHPDIIRTAELIGRSVNSVKMKIGNFGSFDPELKKKGIVGLGNTSKLDEEVWDEFNNNWETLAFQSEVLLAKFKNKTIEQSADIETFDLPRGKEREALIKVRVNQSFFRKTILASYNSRCCITNISIPELLVASHIIPWSVQEFERERLNPRNGLCLNSFHDKAFDKGYITLTKDFKIKVSPQLNRFSNEDYIKRNLIELNNFSIHLPDKFIPSKEFIDYHNDKIFKS